MSISVLFALKEEMIARHAGKNSMKNVPIVESPIALEYGLKKIRIIHKIIPVKPAPIPMVFELFRIYNHPIDYNYEL